MKKLIISYFITSINNWGISFLMPIIVLGITNSALLTSISFGISFLPYILVTPVAGVFGDRYNRKKLLQISELSSSAILLLIISTPFSDENIYYILILTFLISSSAAIHHPIFQAIIPDTVNTESIPKFNSLINIIDNFTSIGIPIIIGILLSIFSDKAIIKIFLVGYLLSFTMITLISYEQKTKKQQQPSF